jgi:tetratricopeptide (TPR) repeat protein
MAHEHLQAALQREPDNPLVLVFAAEERMAVGEWDEAVQLCSKGIASEPLLATPHQNLRDIFLRQGRYEDAERAIRRALEISPTFGGAHQGLSVVLVLEKQLPLALEEAKREQLPGERLAAMALAYSAMNRPREAESALAELVQKHAADRAFYIAEVLAYQSRNNEAFRWLERAYEQKDIWLWAIKGDPLLKNLEHDPRYRTFLKKMKLPV